MLRVNVGLSRKLSRDFNSSGFSINLDGELTAPVSDPEAVIEQVKELYDLAEEALDRQVERSRGDDAIAARDEGPANTVRPQAQDAPRSQSNGNSASYPNSNGRSQQHGTATRVSSDAATSKQVNYLLNIGRRQRLSTMQLEAKIAEILGQAVGLYDLSKRDAASVIDALTNEPASAGDRR